VPARAAWEPEGGEVALAQALAADPDDGFAGARTNGGEARLRSRAPALVIGCRAVQIRRTNVEFRLVHRAIAAALQHSGLGAGLLQHQPQGHLVVHPFGNPAR